MTTIKNLMRAAALLAVAGSAQAQFSSTATVASDYDFRGVSLSKTNPVAQLSLDYAFASGVAIGAWASNLDYGPAYDGKTELDMYLGYTGKINDTMSWTVGGVFYSYPGSDALGATPSRPVAKLQIEPYPEYYVGAAFGPVSVRQWYSNDLGASSTGGYYTEANYAQPLPSNWTLNVHAGYSWGDYWKDDGPGGGELTDYSVGLSYVWDRFTIGAKLTGTDASGDRKVSNYYFANNPRVVGWISTTLPWSKD
jgi:uncharacterized protein (TIGR02001 family)